MKYPLTYRFAYPLIFAWCLLRAIYLQSLSLPSGKIVSLVVHTTAQVVVVVVVVVVAAEPVPCALMVVMLEQVVMMLELVEVMLELVVRKMEVMVRKLEQVEMKLVSVFYHHVYLGIP